MKIIVILLIKRLVPLKQACATPASALESFLSAFFQTLAALRIEPAEACFIPIQIGTNCVRATTFTDYPNYLTTSLFHLEKQLIGIDH